MAEALLTDEQFFALPPPSQQAMQPADQPVELTDEQFFALPAPKQTNSTLGNLARYTGERFPALSGEALGYVGNLAGAVADVVGDDVRLPQQFGGMTLGQIRDVGKASRKALTGVDLGYNEAQDTTFDQVLDKPLTNILPFMFETGIKSLPDMAAMAVSWPGYILARSGEISYDRAKNDGRPEPKLKDLLIAAPFATASAFLDRLSMHKMFGVDEIAATTMKEVLKKGGVGALTETGTEAAQEVIEGVGETVSTAKGVQPWDLAKRAAGGALGGFGVGGTIATGTAALEATTGVGFGEKPPAVGDRVVPPGALPADTILPPEEPLPDSPRLTQDDRASPIPNEVIDAGKSLVEEATGKPSTITTTEVVDGQRRVVDTPVAAIVAKDRAETAALISQVTAGVGQPEIAPLGQQAGPPAGAAEVAATPTPDAALASVAASGEPAAPEARFAAQQEPLQGAREGETRDATLTRRFGAPGTQARTLEEARLVKGDQPTVINREEQGRPNIEIHHPHYETFEAWVGGKKVGELNVSPQGPHASSVTVEPGVQRTGVASVLYDAAEAALGRPMTPSPMGLSDSAISFWKQRLSKMEPKAKQALLQEALDKGIEQGIGKSARTRVDALGFIPTAPQGATEKGAEASAGTATPTKAAASPDRAADPGKAYPIAPRSEWYGEANYEQTGGKLTEMSPDDFLARAKPLAIDETSRENIDDLKAHIEAGGTLDPLKFFDKGKEDGRHRAIAAKELGIARVPVIEFGDQIGRKAEPPAQAALKAKIAAKREAAAPAEEARQPGETDKVFAKRVVDKRPAPKSLPEKYGDYFLMDKPTVAVVPIGDLVSSKTDEENAQGGGNAAKRMAAAAKGELEKRDPITVERRPDGKYLILDGNGTYTSVKALGWKNMPVIVAAPEARFAAKKRADHPSETNVVEGRGHLTSFTGETATPEQRAVFFSHSYKTVDALYEDAQARQDELAAVGNEIAGHIQGVTFKNPGLKDKETSAEKIPRKGYEDAGRLTDSIRAGFEVNEPGLASEIIRGLARHFEVLDEGWSILDTGYFDRKALIRFDDGRIGEVQFWEPHLIKAKSKGYPNIVDGVKGSDLYDEHREIKDKATPRAVELHRLMNELYDYALSLATSRAWATVIKEGRLSKPDPKYLNLRRQSTSGMSRQELMTSEKSASTQSVEPGLSSALASKSENTTGRSSQLQNLTTDNTSFQPTVLRKSPAVKPEPKPEPEAQRALKAKIEEKRKAAAEPEAKFQARTLREGTETPASMGLPTHKPVPEGSKAKPKKITYNTREIAAALEARQRERYGTIARNDRSPEAMDRISDWIVDEVDFESHPDRADQSGAGWYSTKFQNALDRFSSLFPELLDSRAIRGSALQLRARGFTTVKQARNFLTALIAVTSDGQKAEQNFIQGARLYNEFRRTGTIDIDKVTFGADRNLSIKTNLANILHMLETYGPEEMHNMLMAEQTVSELRQTAQRTGATFSTEYQGHVRLPLAAVIFGPKLGAFYANLMGAHGYLTMDRWWSRTFNRYRGQILKKVSGLMDRPTDARGNKIGLARFKEMIGQPNLSDEQALSEALRHAKIYEEKGFKNGTDLEKTANTIRKDAIGTEDMPFGAVDRTFMIETTEMARQKLAARGVDISLADIQAILWYFEKRLYSELGARQTADVSYEEIANRVAQGAAAGARPAGPAASATVEGPDGARFSVGPQARDQDAGREEGGRQKVSSDQSGVSRETLRGGYAEFTLRPEFKAKAADILATLQPLLDKLAPGTPLRIFESIRALVNGVNLSVDAQYLRGVVDLAMNAEGDLTSLLHHEAVHALWDSFTNIEKAILIRRSKKEWITDEIKETYAEEHWVEEGIAHAIAQWHAGTRMDGIVAKAFKRFMAIVRAIGSAFTANGIRTAEDVFADVASGKIGQRLAQAQTFRKPERDGGGRFIESLFQAAWHGTPHLVDRFSTAFMGTGEGVQAYGWGLYFAGKKEVGEYYRETLSGKLNRFERADGSEFKMDDLTDPNEQVVAIILGPRADFDLARDSIRSFSPAEDEKWQLEILDRWEKEGIKPVINKGNLYKVNVPEDSELMNWDVPLSKQPPAVREKLLSLFDNKDQLWIANNGVETNLSALPADERRITERTARKLGGQFGTRREIVEKRDPSGEALYRSLTDEFGLKREGADKLASEALRAAGIPGHRFLDQFSRAAGTGTHNYVIYDDAAIDIEARFALTQAPHTPRQVQQTMQGFITRGQPIDRAIRLPLQLLGGIDEQGRWRPGKRLSDKLGPQRREGGAIGAIVGSLAGGIFAGPVGAYVGAPIGATVGAYILGSAPAPANGRFGWFSGMAENAKRGLISNYGLDPEYVEAYRKSDLGKTAILRQAAGIMKVLHNAGVGTTEAKVLQAILSGKPVVDAEMTRLAEPIRKAIDDLGAEAVSLGLISAESFERNRGAYLHRVYQKHEAFDDGSLAGWVSKAMSKRRKRIIGDELKGRGMFWDMTVDRLMQDAPNRAVPAKGEKWRVIDRTSQDGRVSKRVYVPADKPTPVEFTFPGWVDRGEWEVRQIDAAKGTATLWRDYTEAERSQMGEIIDARYTIAKTFMLMANDLSTGRFYKEVSQKAEWTSDTEPTSPWKEGGEYNARNGRYWTDPEIQWVKVPDTAIAKTGGKKKWGALSGKWIRAEIWRDLNEVEIASNPGTWRKLYAQWKKNKTARNPVVHMNNIMSNVMFMDMADIRAQDLIGGINAYFRNTKDFQEALENGAFGSDIVAQELRDDVLKPILDEIAKQSTGGTTLIPFLAKAGVAGVVADKLWTWAKTADNGMLRAYQMEDEIFRMAAYMRRRSQGATPAEAGREARDQFLNYDIRAPWVLALRNTMLPFISYTYRAVPKLAENIMHRPWKIAKYAAIAYAVNALSYLLDEGDDDEDKKKGRLVNREQMERAGLRDEEQGYTWLLSPRMVRMPWRDEHGMPVFLDVRRWIPAGDVFDSAPGSTALPIPAPLQFGGPLQLAFEFNLNKSAFTGEQITNELTDTPFEKASDVADWAWKSWAPASFWTPRSWYWTKIANALYGAKDASGNVYSVTQAVLSSVGIKIKPLDVENGVMWHYKDFRDVKNALRTQLRSAGRQLDRGMISQSTFDKQAAGILHKFENLGVKVDDLSQRTTPQREPVE